MDSQRTQVHKLNPRTGVLFPGWRTEKIQFDDAVPLTLDDFDDEDIETPVLLTQTRQPAWQDTDLHSAM